MSRTYSTCSPIDALAVKVRELQPSWTGVSGVAQSSWSVRLGWGGVVVPSWSGKAKVGESSWMATVSAQNGSVITVR